MARSLSTASSSMATGMRPELGAPKALLDQSQGLPGRRNALTSLNAASSMPPRGELARLVHSFDRPHGPLSHGPTPRSSLSTPEFGGGELSRRELELPGIYTQLAHAPSRQAHVRHQEAFGQAIAELRSSPQFQRLQNEGAHPRDLIAAELPRLLDRIGFAAEIYQPRSAAENGYGRYLLHSGASGGDDRFCLQIFAFAKGQKTPIHDHPNECASFIARGQLSERLFARSQTATSVDGEPCVAVVAENDRLPGSWAGFHADELDIPHSLAHKEGVHAVSVHLYRGMDGLSEGERVAARQRFGVLAM